MNAPPSSKCLICGTNAQRDTDWAVTGTDCPRCGTYRVNSTVGWLEVKSPDHMVRLSGWVREQNAAGSAPIITPDVSRRIAAMAMPGYRDRTAKALKVIAKRFGKLQAWYSPDEAANDAELLGTSYSVDAGKATELLTILIHDGYLETRSGLFHLSVPGLLAIEAMSASGTASAQGFVAMDFADGMLDAWTNGFDPGIRKAGFRPLRIDSKDYIGGITDEIMSEIRKSRFIVADYTGQRSGVYFEAGFALGLGLPVIPTCRADQIGNLHFDIRHLNTLPWDTPSDLVDSLSKRVRAVIGSGPDLGGD